MKPFSQSLQIATSLTLIWLASSLPASAQTNPIVSDGTLPNNSVVNENGTLHQITGGTTAGSNLFHSFQDFSVPTGSTAAFDNALEIQNIISRVTGGSVSNIDGLIQANGSANLFLLNPNGIIFGSNAQLNIGGSFLGTTASSLKFANGAEFSATNSQSNPLLLVSVPIGLQLGSNPGSIRIIGTGHNLRAEETGAVIRDDRPVGVGVQPGGKTLALVGGDITLDGGNLTAEGGRIELWSGRQGELSLDINNGGLTVNNGQQTPDFGDIQLLNAASVDVSGEGGGSIQIRGRGLTLQDGSAILAITEGSEEGGTLSIDTSDSVEMTGTTADGQFNTQVVTESEGGGAGGDLTVTTGRLILRDGAQLSSSAFGDGDAGNLTVNTSQSVELIGITPDGRFSSGLFAQTIGNGDAGNLTVTTRQLTVQNGARVIAGTIGFGRGGNLSIDAAEKVEVSGTSADGTFSSNLIAGSFGGVAGAGELLIETGQLLVRGGARIATSTRGEGPGGNLIIRASDSVEASGTSILGLPTALFTDTLEGATGAGGGLSIETARLTVRDGAQISAGTFGSGSGGNVTVRATERVELSGSTPAIPDEPFFTDDSGQLFPSGLFAASAGEGNAGTVRIETGQLIVRDRAEASVSGVQAGAAGNLDVEARSIRLDGGILAAETVAGDQGNISLNASNIEMRRGSLITTNARGPATGGNIAIATDTLVALENSDITANAEESFGGRVRVNAQGIFGTEFREELTPESDITATSELGAEFSGTVEINTPDVDPSKGLVALPAEVVDASGLIARSCRSLGEATASEQSELVITGRGGLPQNPNDLFSVNAVLVDWVSPDSASENRQGAASNTNPVSTTTEKIVEAQGWVIEPNGKVILTASASTVIPRSPEWNSPSCR